MSLSRYTAVSSLLVLLGCADGGAQALIPVDISPGSLVGLKSVDVWADESRSTGQEVRRRRFDWTVGDGGVLQVGLYLPDDFSGEVVVQARAFNAAAQAIGLSNRVTLVVAKGKRTELVQLLLAPEMPAGGDGGDAGASDASRNEDGPRPDLLTSDPAPRPDLRDAGALDAPADAEPIENRSWTRGEDIERDPLASSYTPDLAIDGRGNVIVAWREGVGVKLRRQDGATRTWGAIRDIETRGTTDGLQVAMGPSGDALVVWFMRTSEVDPTLQGLWASHSRDAGLTWSAPIAVHAGPVYYDIALAMAANGTARVAWQESSGNINSLWSAHFNPTTGTFAGAAAVRAGSDSDERYPRLAIDNSGTGILAWVQDDAMGEDSIWAASFASGSLGAPQLLDNFTTDAAGEVDVAIAADGSRGMAVWQQRNGTSTADLYFNEWVPGQAPTWKGPMRVLNAAWVSAPAVVIDRAGRATVAFTQPITGYKWNVVHTRWNAQAGWSAPQALETANQAGGLTTEDPAPHLGLDGAGNIHAVWRRRISAAAATASVIVRRYSVTTMAWQPEVVLGEVANLRAYHPEIAVADEGRAAAAFYFLDPDNTANAASFNVHVAFYR